ncbi:MAG TPA: cytochrome P460 family protein [Bryobacteraceae bacterium]|nr:cytochrome P460 family protein [Bryobacteraceae bacterium]
MPLLVFFLTAAVLLWAEDNPAVPYPAGFRSWQHVKSIVVGPEHKSFPIRGGIHHYYANDKAMEGYRTGKFPNGSVIVDEAVFTKDGEGPAKGITLEGDRRALDVMAKNDQLYSDTGGWGFEHFDRNNETGLLPASARATCHSCHSKQKDCVFSAVRK